MPTVRVILATFLIESMAPFAQKPALALCVRPRLRPGTYNWIFQLGAYPFMIWIRDLRLDDDHLCAVNDHSLEVEPSEACGLIGPNGAGKTTTMRGMRQRLMLAKTLIPSPQILLLDEPASGVNPQGRIEQAREQLPCAFPVLGLGRATDPRHHHPVWPAGQFRTIPVPLGTQSGSRVELGLRLREKRQKQLARRGSCGHHAKLAVHICLQHAAYRGPAARSTHRADHGCQTQPTRQGQPSSADRSEA